MAFSRHQHLETLGLNSQSKPTTIDLVGGILCYVCQLVLRNKREYDDHFVGHKSNDTGIVYTCVVCKKPFLGYPHFRDHCYVKHVIKDKFKCQHCGKNYSKQIVLLNHIKTVHDLECGSCEERFTSKEALQTHKILHKKKEDKLPYLCNSCGKKIYTADTCEQHIDESSMITFPCTICDNILPTIADANKHTATHFNETLTDNMMDEIFSAEPQLTDESSVDFLGILCCYCNMIHKNRTEVDLHILNEHSGKAILYTCNICHKKYEANKYVAFLDHCYFHLTRNRFECTECGKTFPRLSLYVMHTEAYHSVAGSTDCVNRDNHKPFACMLCEDAFKSSAVLVSHLQQHHGERVMQCSEDGCNKFFKSLRELILHKREHNYISQNSCRFCELQFPSLAACAKHIEVHRIKKYNCPICNKEYKEKYLLIKHIPLHFESVLHICKVCGKSYKARNRLVQHNKIHTEARTHKCTYCGKGFFTAKTLEQHLNIHTGMRPFKCMVCDKTFAAKPNWRLHIRRMHDIDVKQLKIDAKDHQVEPTPKEVKADDKDSDSIRQIEIASKIDPNSEMSVDLYMESDDSTMDSVDGREMEAIENNISNIDGDLSELLPPNCATLIDSDSDLNPPQALSIPTELGPDFINNDAYIPNGEYINLDENLMPHIDPLLTIKHKNGKKENANSSYVNLDTNNDYTVNNIVYPVNNIDYSVTEINNSIDYPMNKTENNVNWEPPVFTYLYSDVCRDRLMEASLITVMKPDMF